MTEGRGIRLLLGRLRPLLEEEKSPVGPSHDAGVELWVRIRLENIEAQFRNKLSAPAKAARLDKKLLFLSYQEIHLTTL